MAIVNFTNLTTEQQIIVKTKPRVLYPINFHILHPEFVVITAITMVGEPAIAAMSIDAIRDNEAAVAYYTEGKKVNNIKDYPRKLPSEWRNKQRRIILRAIAAFYKMLGSFTSYVGITKGYTSKEIRHVEQYIEALMDCIPHRSNYDATINDLKIIAVCISKLIEYVPTVYVVKSIHSTDSLLQYAKAYGVVSFSCIHIESVMEISAEHDRIGSSTRKLGDSMLHINAEWLKILSRMYRKQCGSRRLKKD